LANEADGDRPWLGDFHLVAFYGRALSPAEIGQNFQSGIHGLTSPSAAMTRPLDLLSRIIDIMKSSALLGRGN
jgi:hypothetical protein